MFYFKKMSKQELFFKFFESCVVVDGIKRSLICDLQRKTFEFIPKDLSSVIREFDGKKINDIKIKYKNEYDSIIDEYFHFLHKREYIFFTRFPHLFPKISQQYHFPFQISNAIVDIVGSNDETMNRTKTIIEEIDSLKCKNIELRFFTKININTILNMLNSVCYKNGILNSIAIYLPYCKDNMDNCFIENPRINYIVLHGSPLSEIKRISEDDKYIIYTTDIIDNEKKCGIIDSQFFSLNIKSFSESLNHNSCLNRKISIDKDGNIKNCPSMAQSFGNIKDTTLEEALSHPDFKKYWNITKDQIAVCKDCEFRHICTDCRAYTERTHFDEDIDLSKPLKCGYNPYTNEWAEWSTNPLKQKAIEYYGMQELVKND